MPKIYVAHPDQDVRKALIQTLKIVWPGMEYNASATANDPDDIAFAALASVSTAPVRFKALLTETARTLARQKRPSSLSLGECRVDIHAREFFSADGESVMLTEKEVDVLTYLFQRGTPVTRDDLLKDVWNYSPDVDTHTIETHIYRLRQKIEPDADHPRILLTMKDGYQLAATASSKA